MHFFDHKNNKDAAGKVQKLYYNENVYRVSKGTNSFKEIMQTGLECFGDVNSECISQVLMLAAESLCVINSDFVLEISDLEMAVLPARHSDLDENIKAKTTVDSGKSNL